MDRNIITVEDAAAYNRARVAEMRKAHDRSMTEGGGGGPSLGRGTLGGELPIDAQKPDEWYERVLKYVPVEAVSMYLALDRGIAASGEGSRARAGWLAVALMCCLVFNVAYLIRIARVASPWQVVVSTVALVSYVYVNGGVFEAIGLAKPIAQLFVLILTGAVLTFFKPPPLAAQASSA
jgi:hypothetical protein